MENAFGPFDEMIQYFRLNYIQLSVALLFLVAGFFFANFLKRRIRIRLVKKSPNHLTATFISQMSSFVLKSTVVIMTLYLLGLNSFTNKILAGAGILTFIIGFALKDIGENFLAGIILAFKSPFRLNDLIEINGIEGFVKDINIRETMIKTPDGKDVFLPNSLILKNPLFNYTIDGFLRYEFMVGIAFENNPIEAVQLIFDTVNQVEDVLKGDRKATVTIDELATNAININVKFWVDTFKSTRPSVHQSIRSEVIHHVLSALVQHGYSLPASIIELKNYEPSGPLKLSTAPKKA
jgi:small conductance mechanosensitive channel